MLAIIGGSGLETLDGFETVHQIEGGNDYGMPSRPIECMSLEGNRFLFLSRHGIGHAIAPHRINYRANIKALQLAGATVILAVNAVGGITAMAPPRRILLPDQIIDYTYGREQSFFDQEPVRHIDFTRPFDSALSGRLLAIAHETGIDVIEGGTYGCTQGPRLETAAEIKRMQRDGCDMVGMTAMPEAALARELDLAYASIALVVNWAAGVLSDAPVTMAEIEANLTAGMSKVQLLLRKVLLAGW